MSKVQNLARFTDSIEINNGDVELDLGTTGKITNFRATGSDKAVITIENKDGKFVINSPAEYLSTFKNKYYLARGIFAGGGMNWSGYTESKDMYSISQYITIDTPSNAVKFGDLYLIPDTPERLASSYVNTGQWTNMGGTTDFSRAVFAGGEYAYNYSNPTGVINNTNYSNSLEFSNLMQYITISTPGTAQAFGNLVGNGARPFNGEITDSSRGIFNRGRINVAGSLFGYLDYISIGTLGNAVNFGNTLYENRAGTVTDMSLGVMSGGNGGYFREPYSGYDNNTIEYITISTPGNGVNFGNLVNVIGGNSGTSNFSRGIFAGGAASGNGNPTNNGTNGYSTTYMEYITIGTPGNAASFGNMSVGRGSGLSSTSSGTGNRAVLAGGYNGTYNGRNTMEYTTIDTQSTAQVFGNLVNTEPWLAYHIQQGIDVPGPGVLSAAAHG